MNLIDEHNLIIYTCKLDDWTTHKIPQTFQLLDNLKAFITVFSQKRKEEAFITVFQ